MKAKAINFPEIVRHFQSLGHVPAPADRMTAYPVGSAVNRVDVEELLAPARLTFGGHRPIGLLGDCPCGDDGANHKGDQH